MKYPEILALFGLRYAKTLILDIRKRSTGSLPYSLYRQIKARKFNWAQICNALPTQSLARITFQNLTLRWLERANELIPSKYYIPYPICELHYTGQLIQITLPLRRVFGKTLYDTSPDRTKRNSEKEKSV